MSTQPGFDAIEAALEKLYGNQPCKHFSTAVKYAQGGPHPLDGISAFVNTSPRPHFHYITYGFSELYAKESDLPDQSGWGFELSFRFTRRPEETEPPIWATMMLQKLAQYVFQSGRPFKIGDHIDMQQPITLDKTIPTRMTAYAFALDPQLGELKTPNGRVKFTTLVGLLPTEKPATTKDGAEGILGRLAAADPLYIVDLNRTDTPKPAAPAAPSAPPAGQKPWTPPPLPPKPQKPKDPFAF